MTAGLSNVLSNYKYIRWPSILHLRCEKRPEILNTYRQKKGALP